jgi:hypothetical protein
MAKPRLDQLEEAILSLVSQRRAPVPQQVQVVVRIPTEGRGESCRILGEF